MGLLKEELRQLGQPYPRAVRTRPRSPQAAPWRWIATAFPRLVTERIRSHPLITVVPGEVTDLPEGDVVVASGPLTSDALADRLMSMLGGQDCALHFFDAAAPLVSFDSVDMDSGLFRVPVRQGDAGLHQLPHGPRRSTWPSGRS